MSEMKIINEKSSKKLFILSIVFVLLILSVTGTIFYIKHQNKQKEEFYQETLINVRTEMINVGADAETMINGYSKVWHDAIFDDYATIDGEKYYGYNSAILALKQHHTEEGYDLDLNAGIEDVNELMGKLQDAPDEFKNDYELTVELYSKFKAVTDHALSPDGSYQTYSADTQTDINEFVSTYEKLNIRTPIVAMEEY